MKSAGFFTRQSAKDIGKRRSSRGSDKLPVEALHKMGPRAVRSMNPDARSPEMQRSGPKRPKLYCLGEAPGEEEDRRGEPFVGKSGKRLRSTLRGGKRAAYDNCCRTRPPDNRTPTTVELEAFRPSVEASIAEAKPRVILGLGLTPLKWFYPGASIFMARGRKIPVEVAGHPCWFFPTLHPAFVLRIEGKRYEKIQGEEWARAFRRDVAAAVEAASKDSPPTTYSSEKDVAYRGIEAIVGTKPSLDGVRKALEKLARSKKAPLAFDFETKGLRPYGEDSKVLSASISDGSYTAAFGIDHDQARWSKKERATLLQILQKFFTSGHRIAAHNLAFDLEWLIWLLGPRVIEGSRWEDSMQAGYTLDNRKGGLSLDWLCFESFGIRLKQLSFAGSWRNRLHEMPLDQLAIYNGLDAKWTARLSRKLKKRVRREGLDRVYKSQVDRIVPIVEAQRIGLPVDQKERARLQHRYENELDSKVAEIRDRPEVKKFERRRGPFSPTSNKQIGELLDSILDVAEVRVEGSNKLKTDEKVLHSIEDQHPIAKLLLEHRSTSKLLGTYVLGLDPASENTVVWPDGRIHCSFNGTGTDSGRLASEAPNNQNWPKRKHKHVRKQIVPGPGEVFLSLDAGQIEARVLGMASKDKVFCGALWEDYDIHMEWAERVAKLHPPVYRKHDKDIKKLRTAIKNELVFPAFYGASPYSIAEYIGLPERKARRLFSEFWNTFRGVKAWQKKLAQFYEENFYVEALTGRRRYGPLGYNQILNTPIQGTASDIVVAAWIRLCRLARELGLEWLIPVLNVHDDLTLLVPENELEQAMELAIGEMLTIPEEWESWITVPLSVEAEVGYNYFEMEPAGVYRSDEVCPN